jgi:hypothetical protein
MSADSYEPLLRLNQSLTDQPIGPRSPERVAQLLADLARSGPVSAAALAAIDQLGVDWLQHHGLAALTWSRCQPALAPQPDLAANLRLLYYAALTRTERRAQELTAVLRVLAGSGLTPVVFKGGLLAFSVYPDPACRLMGDLDLWLSAAEMPQAQAALEAAGYRLSTKPDRPPALMELDNGEVSLIGPDYTTGLVELHYGVFPGEWLRRAACVAQAEVRARCQPVVLADSPTWTLAPADHLLQIALHVAINHQISMAALRSLLDITLLARHPARDGQPLEWAVIVQRARAWRVATATWLVLSLAVELCGLTEAAAAVQQLAPGRLRQKLIGRLANAESLVNARELRNSHWRYVYLLLLVDRKRDMLKLVYRALWPEDDWLRARYGRSGWRIQLRHLLDAARGRF